MLTLLQVTDARRSLGVSRQRVHELIERGRLRPLARTPRGTYLFSPEAVHEVQAQLRQNKGSGTGDDAR